MEFKLHTTFPSELQAEWNNLLEQSITHVPFLRYEYLEAWWQTRGGGEWPQSELAIISASRDGKLVGVAPFFQATNRDGQPSLLLLGSIEVSDYLDLIARPEDLDEFTAGLLAFAAGAALPVWKAIDLYNLFETSPSLAALQKAAKGMGWSYRCEILQQAPYIPLPGDWETYLAGIDKKQRHEIRRKLRRAQEAEAEIEMRFAGDPDRLEADIEGFMALMAQDPDKAAFLTPAMRKHMRLVMRCASENCCLQLSFLEVNGVKAAGYLSFDYLNRIWVYNSGIDQSFAEYSPGWVLLGYLLKWANEQKRTSFDFMRGNEEYKYRFGAVDRQVVRVVISR
ncbi:MAG TPA: GNAT family N-acetyltransferase [Anaerolineaceae bacterium]|nr:GNAT family N-acetyltransferase [Anaerolineaceae bacterium]